MMIIFQNKIIYMPGVPLGARHERIEDYAGVCSGIKWKEVQIPTSDGHILRGAVAEVTVRNEVTNALRDIVPAGAGGQAGTPYRRRVIIVYFQGLVHAISRLPCSLFGGLIPWKGYFLGEASMGSSGFNIFPFTGMPLQRLLACLCSPPCSQGFPELHIPFNHKSRR